MFSLIRRNDSRDPLPFQRGHASGPACTIGPLINVVLVNVVFINGDVRRNGGGA